MIPTIHLYVWFHVEFVQVSLLESELEPMVETWHHVLDNFHELHTGNGAAGPCPDV